MGSKVGYSVDNIFIATPKNLTRAEKRLEKSCTLEATKSVRNSMHLSIQLEIDNPSNHEDGKMPSLDLKLQVKDMGGAKSIVHEFHTKVAKSSDKCQVATTDETETDDSHTRGSTGTR